VATDEIWIGDSIYVLIFIIKYFAFTLGLKEFQEKRKAGKPCLTRIVVLNVNFSP
jgi:hypothetical protein